MDESNGQQCDGLTDNVSKGYKDGENVKYVMQDTNIRLEKVRYMIMTIIAAFYSKLAIVKTYLSLRNVGKLPPPPPVSG